MTTNLLFPSTLQNTSSESPRDEIRGAKMQLYGVLFLALVCVSQALYVVMREGRIRCVYAEVPKDTLIAGDFISEPLASEEMLGGQDSRWNAQEPVAAQTAVDLFSERPFGIRVTVTSEHDPTNPIHSRAYGKSGRFAVTSTIEGEYAICFVSNITSRKGPWNWKMTIDLHTGAGATDYEDLAKKEHMDTIQIKVRKLLDRASGVRRELDYQKHREKDFRETSESTNARALWWSIFQIAIVVTTAAVQMRTLRQFFIKKKIV